MTLNAVIRKLKKYNQNYYGDRIFSELSYLYELLKYSEEDEKAPLPALELLEFAEENGAITKEICLKTEKALSNFSEMAKRYKVFAVGHAHIDMNWMWSYNETVDITLETFRTILKLMDEIPGFTFAQSQASCYAIVEKYDLDLLEKIKERVREGRWEVTVSQWVEGDKNMSNGESISRHLLYSKNYMNKLFSLKPEELEIDYEPDTFGHSANNPEILYRGGVKYYYHCRGFYEKEIYFWEGQSGKRVLAYREPKWYLGDVKSEFMIYIPTFCYNNKVDAMLYVFGAGDHGGGPTRRDINKLIDMKSWPIFPTVEFGTYHSYFKYIENFKDNFPIVKQELNFIFTGCYTTQSRIKSGNKQCENLMAVSEAAAAAAGCISSYRYNPFVFQQAWENILFNQFHDILPGSCIDDSREYAGGLYQETKALAHTQKMMAYRAIADKVDTSFLKNNKSINDTVSEGAGVGFGYTERGAGVLRGYFVFNMTQIDRSSPIELVLWDYPEDLSCLIVKNHEGKTVEYEILTKNKEYYWGHSYTKLLVNISVPAFGYTLLTVDCDYNKKESIQIDFPWDARIESVFEYTLYNDKITAYINPANGEIASVIDNKSGKTILKNAGFKYLIEQKNNMSAWEVGRHTNDIQDFIITDINYDFKGKLRNAVSIKGYFGKSRIEYVLSLDKGDSFIKINLKTDWLEVGNPDKGIPQMYFTCEPNYKPLTYSFDIACGGIKRESLDMDVPGLSYCLAVNENGSSVMIISEGKYAYRNFGNKMSLTLIRSSYNPDPYPELGRHDTTFYIGLTDSVNTGSLALISKEKLHDYDIISASANNGGILPGNLSIINIDKACVSAIKLAEDNSSDIIVRIYEPDGKIVKASAVFAFDIKSAYICDILERKETILPVSINKVNIDLCPNTCLTIRIIPSDSGD